METPTDDLLFAIDDRVATITLNRPDRLNALSDAMIDAAVAALQRCATDPDVGAVLLTGAGRAFCAGGDVSAMKENVNLAATSDFRTLLDREAITHLRCGQTDDHKEGVAAFLEKRAPRFVGR